MEENKYISVINEIETIEEIITPPKYRRCCHSLLELIKAIVIYLKEKRKKKI